jgi:hypothetical protein
MVVAVSPLRHVWAWKVGTVDEVLCTQSLKPSINLDSNVHLQHLHAPIAGVNRKFALEIEFQTYISKPSTIHSCLLAHLRNMHEDTYNDPITDKAIAQLCIMH